MLRRKNYKIGAGKKYLKGRECTWPPCPYTIPPHEKTHQVRGLVVGVSAGKQDGRRWATSNPTLVGRKFSHRGSIWRICTVTQTRRHNSNKVFQTSLLDVIYEALICKYPSRDRPWFFRRIEHCQSAKIAKKIIRKKIPENVYRSLHASKNSLYEKPRVIKAATVVEKNLLWINIAQYCGIGFMQQCFDRDFGTI